VAKARNRPTDEPPPAPAGDKAVGDKAVGGKQRRRKDPLWAKLCIGLGALILVGSGATVVGSKVLINTATNAIPQQNLLGDTGAQAQAPEHHVTITGAKTILLIGLDNRPGQNPSDLVRSDSIMLLHVPTGHDRAYLVSIPRDTYVQVPADRKTGFGGGAEKINAAFAYGAWHGGGIAGGVQLLSSTIAKVSGIHPDAAAIIDFTGFQQVVNVLGGVDMCIDEKTTSIHTGHTKDGKPAAPFKIHSDGTVGHAIKGVIPTVYQVGCRHLAAWQALDYVRQRDLLANHDLDYGRQRHQQQFIKAIFKKIFSAGTLTNFSKLTGVLSAMGKAMTVDSGGISPADWVYAMRDITPDNVVTVKTNAGRLNPQKIGGIDYELLSSTSLQLLRDIKSDTVESFVSQHPDWVSTS
jgi:LCP family protein required for cell wall assembly